MKNIFISLIMSGHLPFQRQFPCSPSPLQFLFESVLSGHFSVLLDWYDAALEEPMKNKSLQRITPTNAYKARALIRFIFNFNK